MEQTSGPRFEIGEAIRLGWTRLWPNVVPMVVFAVIVWMVNVIMPVLQEEVGGLGSVLLAIASFLISALIGIGWIRIALDITDGEPVTKDRVVGSFGVLVPYLIASILLTVMAVFGLILFIIPGIIVIIAFGFFGFHIVDTGESGPIAALRRSAQITKGERLHIFGLGLVLLALNILGLIALIVGVLITSAISLLAVAHVYRRLEVTTPGSRTDGQVA